LLERLKSILREVLDRRQLRRQIVVQVGSLQRRIGKACNRGDRRTQSVLMGLDVVDTRQSCTTSPRGQPRPCFVTIDA
jgi:hypothetical protein